MDTIRISFKNYYSIKEIDPVNIKSIYQSNLIENLYSRLIEYDNENQLQCVLCSEFEINKNIITFHIRENLKTSNGNIISSSDIVNSYQRLIKNNSNTHGNLLLFIESEKDIYSINNNVIIKLKDENYINFMLPLLATMDFSIIPNSSITENKIIDYTNTTGPYCVELDDELGYLVLKANKNHPYFNNEMFQKIKIIPPEDGKPISDLLQNKVDLLDLTFYPNKKDLTNFLQEKNESYNLNKTNAIRITTINISKNARNKFKTEELKYFCETIKQSYLNQDFIIYDSKETNSFFQPLSTENQINNIQKAFYHPTSSNSHLGKKITLGVSKNVFQTYNSFLEKHPFIEVKSYDTDPAFLDENNRPDLFIQTTDSSFSDDISMLSYNFSMGYFGKTREEGDKWISLFINETDRKKRIQLLEDLQSELITTMVIYPISSSSYWSISKENINLSIPKQFPGSMWWKIKRK